MHGSLTAEQANTPEKGTAAWWLNIWARELRKGQHVGFFSDEREREDENDEQRTHWGRP